MSCGTCGERTKAGASAATGAPVATGAVAQRHCPQCGKFLPKSGQCTNCRDKYSGGTMFVTRSTQAALKLAQAVAALDPMAIPGPEPLWPGDKDAGIHIDLHDGYFIRTYKHTLGRTFAEVSQIGADQLPQQPHATKGLSVYVGKGGNGHQRAVKALIHESEELSKFLVARANMERQGSRLCERCARYVDAGGAGHTTGCDDNRATAVTLDARESAAEGRPITDPEILKSADREGWTVAHIAAEHGQQFTDPEILKLANRDGWTVAHTAAEHGQQFTNPEILRLADGGGRSVAHVAAVAGQQFTDPEILKLANSVGWTVAHVVAEHGQQFTDQEILKLANRDGWTVAHASVRTGQQFTDPEILKLADKAGRTVAHVAAEHGQQFTDREILKLADKGGRTVAHAAAKGGQPITDPEILKLADMDGQTVKQCIANARFFDEKALQQP